MAAGARIAEDGPVRGRSVALRLGGSGLGEFLASGKFHRSGRKRLRHPAVGELDLNFEAMQLPADPDLQLNVYTAAAGSPAADGLSLLATWAATHSAENSRA